MAHRAELAAREIRSEADQQAWYNRSKFDLADFLARESIPSEFVKIPFMEKRKCWFPESDWDQRGHPERGYVWGNCLQDAQIARDPFTDFDLMIATVANTIASTRSLVEAKGFEALHSKL